MNRRIFLTNVGAVSTVLVSGTAHAAKPAKALRDAQPGENAAEFLVRSVQNGPTVVHYGYLTHLAGLPDDELFSHPTTRNETTARFTLTAGTTLDSRHELGNIITTSAPGELHLFHNETPQGNFSDPASFAHGQVIAGFSIRYHNVLNVQAPNQGIVSGAADLVQLRTDDFGSGQNKLRFGHPGLRARLTVFGQGTRTNVDPLSAFFLISGAIVILD